MKVFIVAALLVASVAGQSLDMYKSVNKDLTTSRKGMMVNGNRFLNRPNNYYYGGDYPNMINTYGDFDYPSTYNTFGNDDTYMNVLSYEEITQHPLFRVYMGFPLFRQYWSYPMFQRYVCSQYFQSYWTLPQFQQYFISETMFYRYIFPIVQLFKYDTTTVNTYTGGDWIWNRNPMGGDYYYQQQQQQYGLPNVCSYKSEYCQALFQKMYNHLMYTIKMIAPETTTTSAMDISDMYKYNPYYARMMYPTSYNKEMYPTVYNREMYPTVYNKEMYPTVYNREMYPTVYNKEFQNFEVPSKTAMNDNLVRPFFINTLNKAMIGDKTLEQKVAVPEQMVKV